MASQVIFIYLAIAIISLSVVVITRKNPVHSIVFMLLLFFHIAGLYISLNAEFLAAIQVIVYAGAILVLFLFVVLMLNLKEEVIERRYIGLWPIGLLLAVAILGTVLTTLKSISIGTKGSFSPALLESKTPTKALGEVLYTEYLFPFEIASVVLLVAIVGAIVLAKKRLKS